MILHRCLPTNPLTGPRVEDRQTCLPKLCFTKANMAPQTASSIFEYLTSKNPTVNHDSDGKLSKNNTTSRKWLRPRQLREWDEFSYDTMERAFRGEIMRECHLGRELIYPPNRPKEVLQERGENSARGIAALWTQQLLEQALSAVASTLNPVYYVAGDLSEVVKGSSRSSFYPDGASVTPSELNSPSTATNRLPSDIKPALKWESAVMLKSLLNDDGHWKPGKAMDNIAAPIRQLYTYCVRCNARYGFLLTSKEVFLIRIRPLPEYVEDNVEGARLKQAMRNYGLVEYKSIPWDKHRDGEGESEFQELTISLSLWFIHVLAGSNHELQWKYDPLGEDEKAEAVSPTALSNALRLVQSFVSVVTEADTVILPLRSREVLLLS